MRRFSVCSAAITVVLIALLAGLSFDRALAAKSSKDQKIRQLLEITGAAKLGGQVVQQMFPSLRQMAPQVPANVWDDLEKEMEKRVPEMADIIVPIYDKHFTESDIDGLIAFYRTPVGKKFIKELPSITQESMTAGQRWGASIGQEVVKRLAAQGYDL